MDVTIIKVHSARAWSRIMQAAELAGIEWASEQPLTVTLYGEPARQVAEECHRRGLPMRGVTTAAPE